MKSIFFYTNYREFLSDFYVNKKESDSAFSFRVFARRAGFSSPNFLKLVMDGKKNVGRDSIQMIAGAMRLKKRESEYFSYLVFFNQAKNDVDKNYYFGLLASFRTRHTVSQIRKEQFNYYNEWYTIIIRELIRDMPVDMDPAEIAKKVVPPILPKQVKKSIKTLKDLGFITEESGVYKLSSLLIKTDAEVHSLAVRNFHAKMSELAGKAVKEIPLDKRHISSVTVKISGLVYKRLCRRIDEFRDEVIQMIKEDQNVDRVYQVNFQVFPVSKEGV